MLRAIKPSILTPARSISLGDPPTSRPQLRASKLPSLRTKPLCARCSVKDAIRASLRDIACGEVNFLEIPSRPSQILTRWRGVGFRPGHAPPPDLQSTRFAKIKSE